MRRQRAPFDRRLLDELAVEPDAVAADLDLVPVTHLDGIAADEFVAASPRRSARSSPGLRRCPLTRVDVEERGRVWGDALVLGGCLADDYTVLPLAPHPAATRRRAQARCSIRLTATMRSTRGRGNGGRPARRRDSRARATAARAP